MRDADVSEDSPNRSEYSDLGDEYNDSQIQTVKQTSKVSNKSKPIFHKLIEKKQDENFDDSYDKYDVFKETPISPQYPNYDK